MRIEVVKNGRFRFWLSASDLKNGGIDFKDWVKASIVPSERRYDSETGIWAIDARHREAVIREMGETFVPGPFELKPVEELEAVIPKRKPAEVGTAGKAAEGNLGVQS